MNHVQNPDLCQSMGDAGRLRASEEFGLDKMVDAYDSLYRQMGGQD